MAVGFTCPVCGLTFRNETELRQHLLTAHEGGGSGSGTGSPPPVPDPATPPDLGPMPGPGDGAPPTVQVPGLF
jgi:hypothetical protein